MDQISEFHGLFRIFSRRKTEIPWFFVYSGTVNRGLFFLGFFRFQLVVAKNKCVSNQGNRIFFPWFQFLSIIMKLRNDVVIPWFHDLQNQGKNMGCATEIFSQQIFQNAVFAL